MQINRQHFQKYLDISPWNQEQKILQIEQPLILKPLRNKLSRKIINNNQKNRLFSQKPSSLRTIEYTLPQIPKIKRKLQIQDNKSITLSPTQKKIHKSKSKQRIGRSFTIVAQKKPQKIRLKGKKFDPIPTYRVSSKWISEQKKTNYKSQPISQHTLIFTKRKEDILKDVLYQLKSKLK